MCSSMWACNQPLWSSKRVHVLAAILIGKNATVQRIIIRLTTMTHMASCSLNNGYRCLERKNTAKRKPWAHISMASFSWKNAGPVANSLNPLATKEAVSGNGQAEISYFQHGYLFSTNKVFF